MRVPRNRITQRWRRYGLTLTVMYDRSIQQSTKHLNSLVPQGLLFSWANPRSPHSRAEMIRATRPEGLFARRPAQRRASSGIVVTLVLRGAFSSAPESLPKSKLSGPEPDSGAANAAPRAAR